jgi:hypothetical protein
MCACAFLYTHDFAFCSALFIDASAVSRLFSLSVSFSSRPSTWWSMYVCMHVCVSTDVSARKYITRFRRALYSFIPHPHSRLLHSCVHPTQNFPFPVACTHTRVHTCTSSRRAFNSFRPPPSHTPLALIYTSYACTHPHEYTKYLFSKSFQFLHALTLIHILWPKPASMYKPSHESTLRLNGLECVYIYVYMNVCEREMHSYTCTSPPMNALCARMA